MHVSDTVRDVLANLLANALCGVVCRSFSHAGLSLFLQGLRGLARTLAGTGIGARALAAHRQAATMAEATIATDVHQSLDVHRGLAAQIAFDGEERNLIADLFEIAVGQIFDLLRIFDTARFADLTGARATDTKNGGQADFSVLVRWLMPAIRAMCVL